MRLYARCFRDTITAIGRNAWTLLIPVAVLIAQGWLWRLAAPLGIVGGILATLATSALYSSYLYFLGELVRGSRLSVREMKRSLGAYLWSVVNVTFVIWLASLALQLVLAGNPNAAGVQVALWLVALVAFNTVPEVIYLRGTYGGLQTIAASWDFLKGQWIPWFAANAPPLAALALVAVAAGPSLVGDVLAGAALHVFMVFRGNLFRALDGTSHRQRMYTHRAA